MSPVPLRSASDIDAIGRAGEIIGALFDRLAAEVEPGRTTEEIDRFVEGMIRSHAGAEPAFKGLYGFPASACVSVNEEIVHGIPREDRVLRDGDIITVDVGVLLDGWYADSARTFAVGEIDEETRRLLEVTHDALRHGIAAARPGNRLGDLGHAMQTVAENAGFSVVRELVGHGIGRAPHEEPQVPNFGSPGRGLELEPGMVLAIEPMFNAGGPAIRTLPDRWTVVTVDGRNSAHFEHTVAVTEGGPRVLTAADRAPERSG